MLGSVAATGVAQNRFQSQQTTPKQLTPAKSPEAYAEFTQLQRLLQQYQQNLGAVGKAVTAFTKNLWRRKSASGKQYDLDQQSPEAGQGDLTATEVPFPARFQVLCALNSRF